MLIPCESARQTDKSLNCYIISTETGDLLYLLCYKSNLEIRQIQLN